MSNELLHLLGIYAKNNDIDKISALMLKIPLEQMDDTASDKLLIYILNNCFLGDASDVALYIINRFNELTPDSDKELSLFTRLFTMRTLDDRVLSWIIPNMETECYEFVINELITYDATNTLLPTYQRATKLYSGTDNDTYQRLYTYALDQDNNIAAGYLKVLMAETNEFAPIPNWVYNFGEDLSINLKEYVYEYNPDLLPKARDVLSRLPEIKFEEFKLPTKEESINLLTEGLATSGLSQTEIETSKELLSKEFDSFDDEAKMKLLQPVIESLDIFELKGNVDLFRILGPVNPHYDSDLSLDHICYKYGGCRLQTCTCFEFSDDENDIPAEDWFTGVCQECNLRLRSRAHALRKPLPFGGWIGCFCSAECIRESIVIPNILSNLMIDRIVNQLATYKIQDKLENTLPDASNYANVGTLNSSGEETY